MSHLDIGITCPMRTGPAQRCRFEYLSTDAPRYPVACSLAIAKAGSKIVKKRRVRARKLYNPALARGGSSAVRKIAETLSTLISRVMPDF